MNTALIKHMRQHHPRQRTVVGAPVLKSPDAAYQVAHAVTAAEINHNSAAS